MKEGQHRGSGAKLRGVVTEGKGGGAWRSGDPREPSGWWLWGTETERNRGWIWGRPGTVSCGSRVGTRWILDESRWRGDLSRGRSSRKDRLGGKG